MFSVEGEKGEECGFIQERMMGGNGEETLI